MELELNHTLVRHHGKVAWTGKDFLSVQEALRGYPALKVLPGYAAGVAGADWSDVDTEWDATASLAYFVYLARTSDGEGSEWHASCLEAITDEAGYQRSMEEAEASK